MNTAIDTKQTTVGVLDLSIGNTGSIINIIKSVGGKAERIKDHQHIERYNALVLPGVGRFDHGITRLRNLGFEEPLTRAVLKNKTPILGICLGMQLMCNDSEEGSCPGLKWIDASIKKLPREHNGESMIIPHMGWNRIRTDTVQGLFKGLDNARFYFVHSYGLIKPNETLQSATTTYGTTFISGFIKENILAAQFHPEKSHKHGKLFFRNFIDWISDV
ncbi:imidazole glycerol phosphate synthase subunit HisH [Pelagicoccus sp. SDUM812005]|uniref:imidazole glycerol phosphate synthase subunit HisH n=1 Tax=Pelagicoccus sp. SDUM812005 TaxID=3041257 RepID=UPI00280F28D0|nr:imidazole glycerol phosphate synthase subunit HisH [Pelagicoccus sp. SDUM812005]MDQ8180811.1 imidazole glycerol phosphate synthase subunit HisH [Pelagicoccus sp. SDUM812005]